MINVNKKEKNIYSLIVWANIINALGYIISIILVLSAAYFIKEIPFLEEYIFLSITCTIIFIIIISTIISLSLKNKAYTLETLMNIEKKS